MKIGSKGSKKDLITSLKKHLEIPEEFSKIFSKFWGGSGNLNSKLYLKTFECMLQNFVFLLHC